MLRLSVYVILSAVLVSIFMLAMACSSSSPTATPAAPATAAAPSTPTPMSRPTATAVPGAPTPTAAVPTPTRVLPTATPVSGSGQPVYGGTLYVAAALDNKTMDPQMDVQTWGRPVTYTLFNTIVGYDPDFKIIPEIAKSWDFSSDGTLVTFHMVPGIKFQDGSPLDAAAVKWSLERVMNPDTGSPYKSTLAPIQSIDVIDSTTFAIHLSAPFRPLLAVLGDRAGFVVPKTAPIPGTAVGQIGSTGFAVHPVGSGPFTLKEWTPGTDIKVVKWDGYWQTGKPYLDEIVYQEVVEPSSQFAMLRTGETDIIDLDPQDVNTANGNPLIKLAGVNGRWYGIRLLTVAPPWNNKDLRQALAYAIDRNTVVSIYFDGYAKPAYTPIGTGWAYNPDLKPYTYDLTKAKQKMVDAGYPNGLAVTYYCETDTSTLQLCAIYQSMAAKIGLTLNIKPLDRREYTPGFLNRTVTNRTTSWRPRADPDGLLRLLFYSKGGQALVTGYSNPEVDKLLDQADQIYDVAKAKQIYDEAQQVITEDASFVFVALPTTYAGINIHVQNFQWVPDYQWRLSDLWLSK